MEPNEAVWTRLGEIEVFVLAGRGVNPVLAGWLELLFEPGQVHVFDPAREIPDQLSDKPIETVCAARNEMVRRFLAREAPEAQKAQEARPWLLMLDDDVYPVAATTEMLTSDLPVAACHIWGKRANESHTPDGLVCLSAVKIARAVLEEMDPPYFDFTADGNALIECECMRFSDKAEQLGFAPTKVGRIGHCTPFVATALDGDRVHVVPESAFPVPTQTDLPILLQGANVQ